ncbi:MAG: ATP-binding protein [Gemmatimonadota bacterium]|nr:ATP-binding protein [Gemmatimonadota bacterium]
MPLRDQVRIARRFLRSIRVDTDLGELAALQGFICPKSSADVLTTMARAVSETGHGAFTWTGPYGSGKSSLVIALSALLDANPQLREAAEKIFGEEVTKTVRDALPCGSKGWRIIPVVGTRADPVSVIGEALRERGVVSRAQTNEWNETDLVKTLAETTSSASNSAGLILFIDEMGKFLEAAANETGDAYVFQQLAEIASRSEGRFLVIGVLHQAFEEYAHRLSHETRDEWAKIQGRFIDLPVNLAGEEQIELIARAIECEDIPQNHGALSRNVAGMALIRRSGNLQGLATTLKECWPLHPTVACLLGPISRRRFGQAQRSVFGFLNSSELYGFQDFLNQASLADLYGPDQLWDYLRTNLEPTILASPDGHRWALAAEALERCESLGGDDLQVKLLKAIAIIDMFKEQSGLVANTDLLSACFPTVPAADLEITLTQLDQGSFTVFRKYLEARAIFAGSDFDIESAIRGALDNIEEIDFNELKQLAGFHSILAKRHYHETGAMRWFEVNIVPLEELIEFAEETAPSNGAIGHFLLGISTKDENKEHAESLCRKAAQSSGSWDIIVGVSQQSWAVMPLARELLALESVNNDHPELAGDPVARREVSSRLAVLQGLIEAELQKAFDSAKWFRKHYSAQHLRQADLNTLASDLADKRFNESPILHNELLNRQLPSSNAIAAQNKLLRAMVLNEGEPHLGMQGYPPERGLLSSILESTGLYAYEQEQWRFVPPNRRQEDLRCLAPMWRDALQLLKDQSNRAVAISELYEIWRKPPYGLKDGLMTILGVAFYLSCRDKLAVYRNGVFRARFDDVDVDYLAKDPSFIQLRWMELSETARHLLSGMAEIVRDLDDTNDLAALEPIDVARGLIAIYDRLPQWTTRTMRLSKNALKIRELFKNAHDPNQFLFNDIPETLQARSTENGQQHWQGITVSVREGLQELVEAYPSVLRQLRDIMLSELLVPNTSSQSLADLRSRAENIKQLAGDLRLDAFIGRLATFDGGDEHFEGIASLAASKPPKEWVDLDLDQARIEVADLAQKFLRAEMYARVKGRRDKRHAMAVVIDVEGQPEPLLQEFDVADSERPAVNRLVNRVGKTLDGAKGNNIVLAALAQLSSRYMSKPELESEDKNKGAST